MTSLHAYGCRSIGFLLCLGFTAAAAAAAGAQPTQSAALRGTVKDQSGAAVTEAWVTLLGNPQKFSGSTDREGRYRFDRVPAGRYVILVTRHGFMDFTSTVELTSGAAAAIDVTLKVAIAVKVDVKESLALSSDPRKNLSGLLLTQRDLAGLSDDPRQLLLKVLELAGSTGRPGDVAVYVNGFREYRRLPPKDTIETIRINSNPFSAEFSQPGAQRIEIVTKPGSDAIHGDVTVQSRTSALEARNPVSDTRPDTSYYGYKGYVQGPIAPGRIGYLLSGGYWQQDDNAFVRGTVLSPTTQLAEPFGATISTPAFVKSGMGQIDFKTGNHTINAFYSRSNETDRNLGLQSGFDLAEHAYDRAATDDVARVWWMTVAGHLVNDVRVEVNRSAATTRALTGAPAVLVLDAFNAGGNQDAGVDKTSSGIVVGDAVTLQRGSHTIKAGAQFERTRLDRIDRSGFAGAFIFGADVDRDGLGRPRFNGAAEPLVISPIEHYRRTVLGLPGYTPSQFFIVDGDPTVAWEQRQLGWFVLDDWSPSRRMTLSYGVRQEIQNDVGFRLNLAPRADVSWLLDDKGQSAIKLGGGLFYRRIEPEILMEIKKLDGISREQLVVDNPPFFGAMPSTLRGAFPIRSTVYTTGEDLRVPFSMVASASFERKLTDDLFAVAQYTFNKGVDLLRLRNVADPGAAPVLQLESPGRSLQHQLMLGLRGNTGDVVLFANYTIGVKHSDTDGWFTVPADSTRPDSEYGWAADDQRHQLVAGATVEVDGGFFVTTSLSLASGRPYNITTGRDNNGDTLFTDRPSFARPGDPGAIQTPFGLLNPDPHAGETIVPRNLGREPAQMAVDVTATKTLSQRVSMMVDVQNLFNRSRLFGTTGVLASPMFGTPNQALSGRRVWLTVRYGF
jgi:hypothetical protein